MVIYRRAGYGRAAVDTRATAAWHGSGYSRQGMTGNGVVSAVLLLSCDSSTAESTGLSIQEMPVRVRFAAPYRRITSPYGDARRGRASPDQGWASVRRSAERVPGVPPGALTLPIARCVPSVS